MTIARLDSPLHGGCLCGRVRYRIVEDPIAFYLCHCTDFQCESGSAFGLSMILRRSALEHERGELRSITVELSGGRSRPATLCTHCLVRLWGDSPRTDQVIGLSPGTLDDPKCAERRTVSSEIQGHCDPRFAKVRDAFTANFAAGREVGASFAATLDGELVIDLWAGHADAAQTRPWQRDSIANVWSTTKAIAALVAHVLADRGALDLDAPVARYWPEFAANGKDAIPVHMLLSHRAGLPLLAEQLPTEALWDWERMTRVIAAGAPAWEPGTASGYHAMTYGYLVGEVVRRVDGRTLGAFFADEIAKPLGADFHVGLAASEYGRCVEMIPPSAADTAAAGAAVQIDPNSILARMMGNPPLLPDVANRPEWRAAEIPAANGHGNARSIAQVMAILANGGTIGGRRFLGADAIARATSEQSNGTDLVLGVPIRWGLGFMLASDTLPLSPGRTAFGHGGWGGSLGIADPAARLSWAYVMNKMSPGTLGDTRALGMLGALYGSL